MARPEIEITKEVIEKAESLAARGLTIDQIASCLDMGSSTLYAKKAEYPEFSEAIKRGQDKGISIIANALFENAKAGNTTAQIFYMKARAKWQDHHKDEASDIATTLMQTVIDKLGN